jgi:MoaA/NifB/PqqE/SkfB family radical SAM enzyme
LHRWSFFITIKGLEKKVKNGDLFIPKTIYIETTNLCNSKCLMCPHEKMKRSPGNMSWALFKKIIDECKTFEGAGLIIALHKDGEPLLDPLLFEKIKYIKEYLRNSTVMFNSNAMLLDKDKARRLLDSGLDRVTFSVDGASKETYEKIRVGLKYDVVKKNLDMFFELKKASTNKTRVTMQMVVCKDNKSEVEKYNKQWLGKADRIFFKSMHNFLDMGTSIKTKRSSKRQLHFCKQPFDLLMIYWNGDIGLCCWDYNNFYNLGNVKRDKIIDVYNNKKFKEVRTAMCNMNAKTLKPCDKCSQIYGEDMNMSYHKNVV